MQEVGWISLQLNLKDDTSLHQKEVLDNTILAVPVLMYFRSSMAINSLKMNAKIRSPSSN